MCVLPPAHGLKAGLVSGHFGQLRVANLVFADGVLGTEEDEDESALSPPRHVFLGKGVAQTLPLLPVCDSHVVSPTKVPDLSMGMVLGPLPDKDAASTSSPPTADDYLRRQSAQQQEKGWNKSTASFDINRSEHPHNLLTLRVSKRQASTSV